MYRKMFLLFLVLLVSTIYCGEIPVHPHEDDSISSDNVYTANLATCSISSPEASAQIYHCDTNGTAKDVFVLNNTAYVADNLNGIVIINITNPTLPVVISEISSSPVSVDEIFVVGDYAFVLEGEESGLPNPYLFSIYNLSDPFNGVKLFEHFFMDAYHLFVDDDFAYVTCDGSYLAIFNISDPTNPGSPNRIHLSDTTDTLFKYQNWLYIGLKASGIAFINVTDPLNPSPPIYNSSLGSVDRIFVNDYGTYLSDDSGCYLSIYDTSDKSHPILLYQTGSAHEFDVWATENYAYVLEGGVTFSIYNVSDLPSSYVIKSLDFGGNSRNMIYSNCYVYIAHDNTGLAIVDVTAYCELTSFPKITLNSPRNNSIISSGTSININFTDDFGGLHWIWYSWDGQSFYIDNSAYYSLRGFTYDSFSVPTLEGKYFLTISANDTYGLVTEIVLEFYVDVTPPTILLHNPPNNTSIENTVVIDLEINDYFLDTVYFNWITTDMDNQSLEPPWDIGVPDTEGTHWLVVFANDSVGHFTVQKYQWHITFLSSATSVIPPTTTTISSSGPRTTELPKTYVDNWGTSYEVLSLFVTILVLISVKKRRKKYEYIK